MTCNAKIVGSVLARVLFVLHLIFATIYVIAISKLSGFGFFAIPIFIILIEAIISFKVTQLTEPKWFCPAVLLFLLCELPIFITTKIVKNNYDEIEKSFDSINGYFEEETKEMVDNIVLQLGTFISEIEKDLGIEDGASVIYNTFLMVLIIGRWLLADSKINIDQKANLLMLYIGLSSDIAEYVSLLSDEKMEKSPLSFVVLIIWVISMFQFSLNMTAQQSSGDGNSLIERGEGISSCCNNFEEVYCNCMCCKTEIWGCLVTILLQDIPFLITRLLALFYIKVVSFTIIFFIFKNVLTISVQFYKIYGITTEYTDGEAENLITNLADESMSYEDLSLVNVIECNGEMFEKVEEIHEPPKDVVKKRITIEAIAWAK